MAGQHGGPDDLRRTRWLEGEGYRVIRFWNDTVLRMTDEVVSTILAALDDPGFVIED